MKPEIRFNGFSDEWVEKKLGDVSKIQTGSSNAQDASDNGEYPFYIRSDTVKKSNKYIFEGEAILIPGEGRIGEIFHYANGKFDIHQRVYAISSFQKISGMYLLNVLRKNFGHHATKYSVKATVDSLRLPVIQQFPIQLPTLPEQQKIGTLFSKYDNIIALREQKLEELNALKKGLLQQMLDDSHKPQVRFSGFNDEWVEKKLGEIATSFEYGLNASAVEFDGVHKYIRITDIDSESRSLNEDTLTSPNICYDGMDKYLVKEGDILFARTGASVGKAYKYNTSDGVAYYAGFLIRMRLKANFDSDFVFQNIFTHKYAKFIEINSQRSGQPGVNSKEYSMFKIQLPSLPEQQKIGQLFKHLDARISNEQSKIEQLKTQKQGLLQRML